MPNSLIGATAKVNGINSGVNETHVFSPTMVNEFRFGYNYTNSGNDVLVPINTLSEFSIPGIANVPSAAAYPDLRIRNMNRTRESRGRSPASARRLSSWSILSSGWIR